MFSSENIFVVSEYFVDVSCLHLFCALSTIDESKNMLYNTSMARKLLIIIALIIAAFPHLGFSHSMDAVVTTVLGLFMAAVLLFSKKPKMLPQQKPEVYPEAKPSPFVAPMHELPVVHPKEESFTPVISTPVSTPQPIPSTTSIPSPLQTPMRKRTRIMQPEHESQVSHHEHHTESHVHTEVPRRARKTAPRVTLSEEQQVQPADVPFSPAINSSEQPHTEAYS